MNLEQKLINLRKEIKGLNRAIGKQKRQLDIIKREIYNRDELIKDLESEINRLYIVFDA